jgi:hypothetical protein
MKNWLLMLPLLALGGGGVIAALYSLYYPPRVRCALPMSHACINNLRLIDGAKQQWALEKRKLTNDIPTLADLERLDLARPLPSCPAGGVYTLGPVCVNPTCSLKGHALR